MNAKEVWDLLNVLGNSAEEVAGNLDKLGIKGFPGEIRTCPIALYLKGNGLDNAYVTADYAREENIAGFSELRVPLPRPVGCFIELFDDHAWPEMMVEEEEGEGDGLERVLQ